VIIYIYLAPRWDRRGGDRMVVWFTINCLCNVCAISAYRHLSCGFESRSWRGVLDTTLSDKACQLLAAVWW